MLSLALPVVLTYFFLMTMALVDLLFVGRLSPEALGAVGLGTSIFSWFMVFGIGILAGLEYLISHARGAGLKEEAQLSFYQGIWVSIGFGLPLSLAIYWIAHHLDLLGVDPAVRAEATSYLKILSFSLVPLLVFTATRFHLQAHGSAQPAMIILVIANGINALLNYGLVLGNWGMPKLAVDGSAWATLTSRIWMMAALLGYCWFWDRRHHGLFREITPRLDWQRLKALLRLGIPSALQMVFEVGVFALSTTLAAGLQPTSLAAHQIVLNIASLTFMVPLGLGSATAVLVGEAKGKGQLGEARAFGWKGLTWGIGFMAVSSVTLAVLAGPIVRLYSPDPQVVTLASHIILIAAFFQLADGAQTVATGALRGWGNTRAAMLANLIGHWAIGLPLGVFLCYRLNWQLYGIWTGLSVGLIVVASTLMIKWVKVTRVLPG